MYTHKVTCAVIENIWPKWRSNKPCTERFDKFKQFWFNTCNDSNTLVAIIVFRQPFIKPTFPIQFGELLRHSFSARFFCLLHRYYYEYHYYLLFCFRFEDSLTSKHEDSFYMPMHSQQVLLENSLQSEFLSLHNTSIVTNITYSKFFL